MRWMVGRLTSRASLIATSGQAGPSGLQSALSKMRACVWVRAGVLPEEMRVSKAVRSSGVRRTIYFLFMRYPGYSKHGQMRPGYQSRAYLSNSHGQSTSAETSTPAPNAIIDEIVFVPTLA